MSIAGLKEIAPGFDRHINWRTMGDMKGFVLSIFSVDPANNTVDFIVKFEPNTKVLYHEHLALTHTFVTEGDHVIFEQDGSVRDSRPVGRYTVSPVTGDVHSEGGGPQGCTLLYSVRGETDALFEILDEEFNSAGVMRISDFQTLLDAQNTTAN